MLDFKIIKKIIIEKLKDKNVVLWLVAINISLYLIGIVFNVIGMPFGFTGANNLLADSFSINWLYIPSLFSEFIIKPYTIITYQFLHYGFFHLLSNMLVLFYFGNTFIQLTHKKKLLPLYVLGGVFSALVFLLIYNLNTQLNTSNYPLVGASGSVMAVLAAVVTLIPDREVLFFGRYNIKYKWIVYFLIGLNLLGINGVNAAGSFAHLGGLLFGYIFIIASKNGIDLSKSFILSFDKIVGLFYTTKQPKVSFVNEEFKTKKQFYNTKKVDKISKQENQKKIDAILDKISQSGYDKLTKAEKEFLFKNSNK